MHAFSSFSRSAIISHLSYSQSLMLALGWREPFYVATHLLQFMMISVRPDCLRSVALLVLKLLMDMFCHIYNGTSSFPLHNAYCILDSSWHSLALNPMLLCIINALFISVSIYVLSMISVAKVEMRFVH